jgi:hypothetical protein
VRETCLKGNRKAEYEEAWSENNVCYNGWIGGGFEVRMSRLL